MILYSGKDNKSVEIIIEKDRREITSSIYNQIKNVSTLTIKEIVDIAEDAMHDYDLEVTINGDELI